MVRPELAQVQYRQDVELATKFLDGWNPSWECGLANKEGIECGVADITAIPIAGGSSSETLVAIRRFAIIRGYPLSLELIKVTVSKHNKVTKIEVTG